MNALKSLPSAKHSNYVSSSANDVFSMSAASWQFKALSQSFKTSLTPEVTEQVETMIVFCWFNVDDHESKISYLINTLIFRSTVNAVVWLCSGFTYLGKGIQLDPINNLMRESQEQSLHL